jgi:hypothetical protein
MIKFSTQAMLFGGAIALGLMPMDAAQAFNLDLNGTTYELSTITGTFDEVANQLATQPWWGNLDLATSAAEQVGLELGYTEARFGGSSTDDGYHSVSTYDDFYQLGSLFAVGLNSDYKFDAQQYAFISSESSYIYDACAGGFYFGCWDDDVFQSSTSTQEMVIGYDSLFGADDLGVNPGYYRGEPDPDLAWTWTIATSLEEDPQSVPEPGMILGYGALLGLGIRLRRRSS